MVGLLGKKGRALKTALAFGSIMVFMVVMATPAAAAGEVGAAVVLPSNEVDEALVGGGACGGHVNNATFDFDQIGTYADPDSTAAFAGQTHVRVEAEEHYRFDAWGTRAANYTCANPLGVTDPDTYWVDATVTVAGSTSLPMQSFSCELDNAAFRRIAITTMMIEGSSTDACSFTGVVGTGSIPAGTLFQWVLETLPCGFPLSEDPEVLFPCDDTAPSYIQAGTHVAGSPVSLQL